MIDCLQIKSDIMSSTIGKIIKYTTYCTAVVAAYYVAPPLLHVLQEQLLAIKQDQYPVCLQKQQVLSPKSMLVHMLSVWLSPM